MKCLPTRPLHALLALSLLCSCHRPSTALRDQPSTSLRDQPSTALDHRASTPLDHRVSTTPNHRVSTALNHRTSGDSASSKAPAKRGDNTQHGNEIRVAFARGQNAITLHGRLGKPGTTVLCRMELNAGQHLRAHVEAVGRPANIRFNRIIFPDGTSDGPFGKQLDYDTRQRGDYALEIGASLMADDAYEGDFELKITVK